LIMRCVLAICVLTLAVVLADPARPNLFETFESHAVAWLRRGSITVHGTGRWGVDQPHGMGVEDFRFDNGSDHHNVFLLQRYDKSTQYEVVRSGQPPQPHCRKSALTPPMNTVWSWVKDAAYKGAVTIRRIKVDYWEFVGAGNVTYGVGVNTSNANVPLWYIRKSGTDSFELHFDHYHHRAPNVSHFAIPKICETEEMDWVEKDPVITGDEDVTAPMDLTAVLTCASKISTCGCPYVWGGNGPCCPGKSGYDCSGMTSHCYSAGGYKIPRTAAEQQKAGKPCGGSNNPGDLLFVGTPAHHVVMYAGGSQIYECPHTGTNCHKAPMRSFDGGCRRIV